MSDIPPDVAAISWSISWSRARARQLPGPLPLVRFVRPGGQPLARGADADDDDADDDDDDDDEEEEEEEEEETG